VWRRRRERWLNEANRFLDDWGTPAVVVGRWITVARYTVAWLAGINRMPWQRFFLANAAGGISWAAAIGLGAYWLGRVAKTGFEAFGVISLVLLAVAIVGHRVWRRRRQSASRP
jgi:membrane-associated protein